MVLKRWFVYLIQGFSNIFNTERHYVGVIEVPEDCFGETIDGDGGRRQQQQEQTQQGPTRSPPEPSSTRPSSPKCRC